MCKLKVQTMLIKFPFKDEQHPIAPNISADKAPDITDAPKKERIIDGYTKRIIVIKTQNGDRSLEAWVRGNFGIGVVYPDSTKFKHCNITHIPTGLQVCSFPRGLASDFSFVDSKKCAIALVNLFISEGFEPTVPPTKELETVLRDRYKKIVDLYLAE